MKRLILLAGITVVIYGSLSAINKDSVTLNLRKQAYNKYHEVKDTVTVRTWMNMDRMNKALMKVVEYDDQLLRSYQSDDSARSEINQVSSDTLMRKPVTAFRSSNVMPGFQMKYILAASVIAGLLILVLLGLLIKRTLNLKKLREEYDDREDMFDSKFSRLEFLENEVVKLKIRENEIKNELEKGIVDYQDKMQTLRKRIEELADENTRLENQNAALSENKFIEGENATDKTDEMKQEIIVELEGILKRVKKSRSKTV